MITLIFKTATNKRLQLIESSLALEIGFIWFG